MVAVGWPPGSTPPGQPGGPQGSGEDWREPYGRGRKDPVSGLYEWYEIPDEVAQRERGEGVSWGQILQHWRLIEADLASEYGVDVEDRALMRARSWRWLETLLIGLLAADTRLARALNPQPEAGVPGQ